MSEYFVLEHVTMLSSRNISLKSRYVPDSVEEINKLLYEYLGRPFNKDGYNYGFLIIFMGSGIIGYIDLETVKEDIRNKKIELIFENV